MRYLFSLAVSVLMGSASLAALAQDKPDYDPFLYPVYEGRMVCDDNVFVVIVASKKAPHHYELIVGNSHYTTVRVPTDSGTIRLEYKPRGIVWLQMSNKSMLFDEKDRRRLANNCRNAAQEAVEKEMITSAAPTLLDPPLADFPAPQKP